MKLPFNAIQFLEVFVRYNQSIWPVQLVMYALGLLAVFLLFSTTSQSSRLVSAILAVMWIWTGAVYHLRFFSGISRSALFFAALFIAGGIGFIIAGVIRSDLSFGWHHGTIPVAGLIMVFYAMVVYPILGAASGHLYPRAPVFGVTPCPVTIFTFGVLLITRLRVPKWVLLAPLAWSLVGVSIAILLGICEDLGLLAAGLAGTGLLLYRDRRIRRS